MEDYKFLFKIVLVGNAGVGKTCIVKRFTQGIFPPGQGATIGVDFMIKSVHIDGIKIKLQIWDTAGQERFRSITQSYYRSAQAIILVFDVTNELSFTALDNWLAEIKRYATPNVYVALVGNKIDKLPVERQVTIERAREFADSHKVPVYIETSAKDSENVNKLFDDIARHLIKVAGDVSSTSLSSSAAANVNQGGQIRSSINMAHHFPTHLSGRTSLAEDAVIDVYHKRNIRNEIINDAINRTKNSCC